jgi:hypothetical protein
MAQDDKQLNSVKNQLSELQQKSGIVSSEVRQSNTSLYGLLSELYLWWREANEIEGFLDQEYSLLPRKPKKVNYGTNFGPLMRITFGINNLPDPKVDVYSRALNAVHREFEKSPKHYEKDGAAKLANFINQSNGLSALAGYRLGEDPVDEGGSILQSPAQKAKNKKLIQEYLLNAARLFNETASLKPLDIGDYFSTDEHDYSLLLVKRTDAEVKWVATKHDKKLIETMLISNYRGRFDATQPAIRPLLELIQTQCLPKHLKKMTKQLIDKSTLVEDGKSKKFKSLRRVMYQHSTGQFVLSPMRADSGVVSLVKLVGLVLDGCDQDVFLPPVQRAILESRCLREFDFNLYDAGESGQFAQYKGDNSASHVLMLEHRILPHARIHLQFWPFYETLPRPIDQVTLNPKYVFKAKWKVGLPHSWFQRFGDEFIDEWFSEQGLYLKRPPQFSLKVTFGLEDITVGFSYKNDEFESEEAVGLDGNTVTGNEVTVLFASKDWAPVMRSISLLGVAGDVVLAVNDDVMRICFKTGGAGGGEHEIHIPTLDEEGNRSIAPFIRYKPPEVIDEDKEYDSGESDELSNYEAEEVAANWPEAWGVDP